MVAWNTDMMLRELYCMLKARERVGYSTSTSFRRSVYQKDFKAPKPHSVYAVKNVIDDLNNLVFFAEANISKVIVIFTKRQNRGKEGHTSWGYVFDV